MKKLYILSLILLVSFSSALAQDAKTLFVNMPDSLAPLLTSTNKLDFIDFLESNMKARVSNRLEGDSEMTILAPTYIRIQMTEQSTWQMKLLPTNQGDSVICVATTACATACDSHLRFYTTNWKELPAQTRISLPRQDDFFAAPTAEQKNEYDELRLKTDMCLVKADLAADAQTITFTYTTPHYLHPDDAEKLKPYLRTPLVYHWDGQKFKP